MLLIGLICLKILCSNITPSRQNKIYFWKLKTKLGMISVTHGSVTVPVGRKKIWTALGANQIAGFVTVSSEKKKIFFIISYANP